METIYPFSIPKANQCEVEDAALEGVVRVTGNGRGAFVFCSEDVLDRRLREASYFRRIRGQKECVGGRRDMGSSVGGQGERVGGRKPVL